MARAKQGRLDMQGMRTSAAATSACLAMMRAGQRALHPGASEAAITRAIRQRLRVQSERVLAAWRRNG